MEEIKSVKLRDNLKTYQQQIGHMVTSLQMILSDAFILRRGENMKVKCLHMFSSIMTSCILA